jgi:hypothetical protein
MNRNETSPAQRTRQTIGEADSISQQPDRDRSGQRHHTDAIGGD